MGIWDGETASGLGGGTPGTCLIAGCGYVGLRLARRMTSRGGVLGLVRSPRAASALAAAGIPAQQVDLDGPGPAAFDVPADLASIVYLVPPPPDGEGDPRLQRFLERLAAARPATVVYLSTTGVYGDAGGRAVDEASPTVPADDASRRRLAAERLATAWCAARGARCVVLRVPGIYGPHRLPLERLERGEPVLRPEDSGPGNRIHVDDLVAACVVTLDPPTSGAPVAGVVNVGDGNHASVGAFLERVAVLAGLPAPRRVTLAEARQVLSPAMLAYLQSSRQVLTGRMERELGVHVRFSDLDEGIRASLREMGPLGGSPRGERTTAEREGR